MSFTSAGSSWRDVYLAAGARGVSACGDFLAATSLALVLQQAGAGGWAISGLLLAASVPLAVLAPITGRIADRADSRTVLIVAGIAQAAVCAALAFASHPLLIIALVALLACGLAVTQPTLAALLPAMVRRADLAKASAINQTAGMVGMLVAPALAGVLVGQFGARVPLLIDALSYGSLVVAGLLIRTRRSEKAPSGSVRWRLRTDRLVFVMIAAIAAVVVGVGTINVVEVFFIRETLGASTTVFGLVAATWTLGMLPGAWLFTRFSSRSTDPGRLVQASLVFAAVTCAAVLAGAAVGDAWQLIPLWLLGGAANGAINVVLNVVLAERVPEQARGRAFAAMGSALQGAGMVGFLLGGPLVDHFAPRPLVAAAGVGGLIAVLLCVPFVRRARREIAPVSRPLELVGDSVNT
ncbi:MAG: MFS transporter [Actinoplanes sp.]